MWKALARAGERVGRGRVERLVRANGVQGAKRRGKPWRTTFPDRQASRPPDLVRRDFSASRPDRKSTRLNSSHTVISYAVFCLKKKNGNCGRDDGGGRTARTTSGGGHL